MKINPSIFIRDLIIKKGLIDYNSNIILLKSGLIIKITKIKGYKKIDLSVY